MATCVLDTKDELATHLARVKPVEERCTGPADMQVPCWGGCKADSHLREPMRADVKK